MGRLINTDDIDFSKIVPAGLDAEGECLIPFSAIRKLIQMTPTAKIENTKEENEKH